MHIVKHITSPVTVTVLHGIVNYIYNQCMGKNRRKTLSTPRGRGGVSI